MQWFADICNTPVTDLLAEAKVVPPDSAPLFLPYLTGERSPHGDPHIRGSFYGLADGMGRAEMMRGVVNAIAFSFADATDSLRAAGTHPSDLLAIGGGAQSNLLLQTIANVLNIEIKITGDPTSAPAFGAARLAAVAHGAAALTDLAIVRPPQKVFSPKPSPRLRDGLQAYRSLYRRLKNIHLDADEQKSP